jgi:hypothetical protein
LASGRRLAEVGARGVVRERFVQGDTDVHLNVRPGDPDLFHQEPHEALATLEVQGLDALPDAAGEGLDPASQPVVDGQLAALVQQRLSLLLQSSLAYGHLLESRAELGEFNSLDLVEVRDAPALGLGMAKAAVEAVQLSGQQLVVGHVDSGTQGRLPPEQGARVEQSLAQ